MDGLRKDSADVRSVRERSRVTVINAKKQVNRRDAIARLLAIGAGGVGTLGLIGSITAQRGPQFVQNNETDPKAVLFRPSNLDPTQRVFANLGSGQGSQAWVSPSNETGLMVGDLVEDVVIEGKVQKTLASFYAIDVDVIPDNSTVSSSLSFGVTPVRGLMIYDAVADTLYFGDDGSSNPSGGLAIAGGVVIRNLRNLSGLVQRINDDETLSSHTIPLLTFPVKSFTLPANTYTAIELEADGYIQTSTTSIQQDVNIAVKFGSTVIGQTMKFNPEGLGVNGEKIPFSIKRSGLQQTTVAVSVVVSGAMADANTTLFVTRMAVYGIMP